MSVSVEGGVSSFSGGLSKSVMGEAGVQLVADGAIPATPVDTTPPSVSLSVPTNTVMGTGGFILTATATDNAGVVSVAFYQNDSLLSTVTAPPFTHSVNFTFSDNGSYNYTAVASDAVGNTAVSNIQTVTVAIPDATAPSVSLGANSTIFTSADTLILTATASDNVSVSRVDFYKNGVLVLGDVDAPFVYTENLSTNASHTYFARAFDDAGNSATSSSVNVVVSIADITVPSVSLSVPSNTVTSSGDFVLTAMASDNVGVAKVEFYRNNVLINTDTGSPFTYTDTIMYVDNGTVTYHAKAYDAANNVTTSATQTVTVNIPSATRFDSALQTTLNAATTKTEWADALISALGSDRTFTVRHDSDALSTATMTEVWDAGVEVIGVGLTGTMTNEAGTVATLGTASSETAMAAADLATGQATFRLEGNGHWVQGTFGLTGSGREMTVFANPTADTGFGLSSGAKINAPLALPVGGGGTDPGQALVNISFIETSGSTQTNVPVTFGQVFAEGAFAVASAGVELRKPDNSTIPCQLDIKATHDDGTIRHAIISALIPSLVGGSTNPMDIVSKNTVNPIVPLNPSTLTGAGLQSVVTIVDAGTTYTASLAALLNAGTYTKWIEGNVTTEWLVTAPLKTAGDVEHPHIHVRFNVRAYNGQNKARVDVIVENTWAYVSSPQTVTYDVTMSIAGVTTYTKTALAHYPRTRYRKTFWWGGNEPSVHIAHNAAYLINNNFVPNYDQSIVPSTITLNSWKATFDANSGPMQRGIAAPSMGTTGGRPDIGILPGWTVMYLLDTTSVMAKSIALGQCGQAGSWGAHWRDKVTDKPLCFDQWPHASDVGTSGDNINPATGSSERLPLPVTNGNPNNADVSHHPEFSYIPYIVTGDHFAYEELIFWTMYSVIHQNSHSTYRDGAKGLAFREQVRGQAWILRSIAHAHYISPDNGWHKSSLAYMLEQNRLWYSNRYLTGGFTDTALGIISHGSIAIYNSGTGMSPWMDDFVTAVFGRLIELGYTEYTPLLMWKSKFGVNRIVGAGVCHIAATPYTLTLRSTSSSPYFTTAAEMYQATVPPAMLNTTCGSQEMADIWNTVVSGGAIQGDLGGYSVSQEGYPSCLQPALAYSKTYGAPNAVSAWSVFDNRTVKPATAEPNQYGYHRGPQFAIVPR